ncbi:hypothetical protein QR680_000717 [Steinernema hermaphroditum]|uniref:protein-tyrosine-phosphatase n=1 Tax=Steinernema hermaphroditum TaxID=289476 RepID=A0AA39GXM5_9BILA|nr:hypothetical protein QR680_000717 [Steinernema hermaphroditum]
MYSQRSKSVGPKRPKNNMAASESVDLADIQIGLKTEHRSRSNADLLAIKDVKSVEENGDENKSNGVHMSTSPQPPLKRSESLSSPTTPARRPRSQYIGDTVWQVDDSVFCGGMESVMNQNLLCRLQVEYIVDLTGLDEENMPRNRRTECPCLCARKTPHSRMTMAISIREDDGPNQPRQDFISFFEDFTQLISRAKSCNKCVLVHSVKGRNRAPAFIAAYLMHNKHITRVQAVAKVGEMMSRMRPGLQISDTLQRALMRWQTVLGIRSNDTSNSLEQQLAVPLFTVKRTAWT